MLNITQALIIIFGVVAVTQLGGILYRLGRLLALKGKEE